MVVCADSQLPAFSLLLLLLPLLAVVVDAVTTGVVLCCCCCCCGLVFAYDLMVLNVPLREPVRV